MAGGDRVGQGAAAGVVVTEPQTDVCPQDITVTALSLPPPRQAPSPGCVLGMTLPASAGAGPKTLASDGNTAASEQCWPQAGTHLPPLGWQPSVLPALPPALCLITAPGRWCLTNPTARGSAIGDGGSWQAAPSPSLRDRLLNPLNSG